MMKSAAMIAVMVALACAVTATAQAPCDCRPSGSWTFFDTSKPVLQFQGCSKIPGEININPNDAVCSVSDACTTAWHPEWFDRNGGSATARFKFCIPSNSPSPAVVPSPSPRASPSPSPRPSPSPSPRPSPSPSPRPSPSPSLSTPSPSPSSPTNLGPCDCRPSGTWTYFDSSKANLQFQGCSKVPGEVNVNPNDGVCQVSDACTSAWHPEWFARNGGSATARFKFCIPGATQTPSPSPTQTPSPSPARSPSPAVCQDQLPPNMCNCQGNPILCQKTCGLCGTANPSPSPSPQRSPSPAVCVDRVTPLECNCKSNPSTCPLSCALCGGGAPDCKDLIDNCRASMCTGSPLQRAACAVTCGLCVPVTPGASPRPSPSPSPRPSPSPSPSGPSGPSGTCLRLPATAAINVSNIICNAVNGNAVTSAAFVKAVTDIMAATWTASNPTLPVPSSSVTGTLTASCGKPSGNQLIVNVNMNFQGAAATLATVLAGARNFNAGGFINNQQFRTAYGVTFSRVDFAVPVSVGDCRSVTTPGTSPAPGNLRIVVPLTWTLSIPSIICGQLPEDSNFRNDFNDVMFQGWDDVSSSSISEKDIVYTDSSFDVSGCDKSQLIVKVNLNLPAGITQSQSFALVQSFLRAAGARIMGQSLVDAYGISNYSVQTGLFGR